MKGLLNSIYLSGLIIFSEYRVPKMLSIEVFDGTTNFDLLIKILKTRLPISVNVYNIFLNYRKNRDITLLYYINNDGSGDIEEDKSWIFTITKRERSSEKDLLDCCREIHLCPPLNLTNVPPHIALFLKESNIFDGSGCFTIAAHCKEKTISGLLMNAIADAVVTTRHKPVLINPCYVYYFPEEARTTLSQTSNELEDFKLKPFNMDQGQEFFTRTWKYSKLAQPDFIPLTLERGFSSGLQSKANSKLFISGINFSISGLMSMLYIDPEFRRKGYGKITMMYLIEQLLEQNLMPCSATECGNLIAAQFHQSIGMKQSHFVPFMTYPF